MLRNKLVPEERSLIFTMIATDLALPTRELETFGKDSAITVTASITSHVQQQVGSLFFINIVKYSCFPGQGNYVLRD